MKRDELVSLLRELIECPPGARPRLLNAILAQRDRALMASQTAEDTTDAFAEWVRKALREVGLASGKDDTGALDAALQQICAHREKSNDVAMATGFALRAPSLPHGATPDEEVIREQVRRVLDKIDGERSGGAV